MGFYVEGEGLYIHVYMCYKLCHKFDTNNHQKQSKVWNNETCTTKCKDVLAKHEVRYTRGSIRA